MNPEGDWPQEIVGILQRGKWSVHLLGWKASAADSNTLTDRHTYIEKPSLCQVDEVIVDSYA